MKAEELRIGNLVNRTNKAIKHKPLGVVKFEMNDFYWIEECVDDFDNYEPIPLTEEWLVRMGFNNTAIKWMDKSVSNPVFIKKDKYYLEFVDGEYYFNLFFGMSNNPVHLTAIKYVHQLQNLYFALTGEELTIKPQER